MRKNIAECIRAFRAERTIRRESCSVRADPIGYITLYSYSTPIAWRVSHTWPAPPCHLHADCRANLALALGCAADRHPMGKVVVVRRDPNMSATTRAQVKACEEDLLVKAEQDERLAVEDSIRKELRRRARQEYRQFGIRAEHKLAAAEKDSR